MTKEGVTMLTTLKSMMDYDMNVVPAMEDALEHVDTDIRDTLLGDDGIDEDDEAEIEAIVNNNIPEELESDRKMAKNIDNLEDIIESAHYLLEGEDTLDSYDDDDDDNVDDDLHLNTELEESDTYYDDFEDEDDVTPHIGSSELINLDGDDQDDFEDDDDVTPHIGSSELINLDGDDQDDFEDVGEASEKTDDDDEDEDDSDDDEDDSDDDDLDDEDDDSDDEDDDDDDKKKKKKSSKKKKECDDDDDDVEESLFMTDLYSIDI